RYASVRQRPLLLVLSVLVNLGSATEPFGYYQQDLLHFAFCTLAICILSMVTAVRSILFAAWRVSNRILSSIPETTRVVWMRSMMLSTPENPCLRYPVWLFLVPMTFMVPDRLIRSGICEPPPISTASKNSAKLLMSKRFLKRSPNTGNGTEPATDH